MRIILGGVIAAIVVLLISPMPARADKELAWQDVAKELMSPACPGRLILDCPSGEGEQLRTLIKQKVGEGWTKKQIMDYFVSIYGEQYLASPAKKGFYLLAWIVPILAVVVGALVVFLVTRVWRRRGKIAAEAASPHVPEAEKDALSKKLDDELSKFDF